MADKKKKGASKKTKIPTKRIDLFCDDKHFDDQLCVLKFEHCVECPIFAEKAVEIFQTLKEYFPRNKFKVLLNHSEVDGKKFEPRYGAFEINFAKHCRMNYHLLWSGIDKGPPRRDKIPTDLDDLAKKMTKILIS